MADSRRVVIPLPANSFQQWPTAAENAKMQLEIRRPERGWGFESPALRFNNPKARTLLNDLAPAREACFRIRPLPIKPTDRPLKAYYAALQAYSDQQITHEGALETAFQQLLADTARQHGWALVPKMTVKRGGRSIIPDGTVRDGFNLHRGYWEAKDTDDDLSAEIAKKTAGGYPLTNTIFEDTRRAVLFQNGGVAFEADLHQPQQLADLLNAFYAHTEPDIEGFEQAVDEFKERVPELALALADKIKSAHGDNAKFQAAFETFFTLCQTALNPNISIAAVDEMLVQHLLTERLIRTIFDKDDFTRQNVIAAEVERVIDALVGRSFSRKDFLKSLDRFYRAIEEAARNLEDFSEKQHFLNTVYERFFQGYSVKTADTHGIVYTPQAIVDFMCASVAEVLETEFGKSLGDKDVQILDPCTGTGNFIVNLLRRIPKKQLPRMYREQLFANEVMLLPYYIAALNIEHAYHELTGEYESFEGLCFVDTLDLAEKRQQTLEFMNEENTARVERQKNAPITVIIGNPPYNVGQLNENDNNKNRKYDVIDKRVAQTYVRDSTATLRMQVYDPYVKFFRWAIDRLENRDGIVCFVTNNSFVDQISFDGMRKHLIEDFTRIYHVHLEGNVRRNPKLAGTIYNVFGIQVGVGITVAVRKKRRKARSLNFVRVEKTLRRTEKLGWLASHGSLSAIRWKRLVPDSRHTWLVPEHANEFGLLTPMGDKKSRSAKTDSPATIFKVYSSGVKTNADAYVYSFDRAALVKRAVEIVEDFNAQLDRWKRAGCPTRLDGFLRVNEKSHKWIRNTKRTLLRGEDASFDDRSIRSGLYRPFCSLPYFFDRAFNEDTYNFPRILPTPEREQENRVICVPGPGHRAKWASLITNRIANLSLTSLDSFQCFPFYVYDEDGTNRRENVTDWALEQFRTHYKNNKITKWDIFHYVYGLLHHAGYREKFADNLKRELPRIPFAPDFKAFAKAGQKLAKLHLEYESLEPWRLEWIETPGVPLSYHVEKMKLAKDKTSLALNRSLTLAKIPAEVFQYRLGNRSALEWVVDQFQISEDKRSGIRSDPNRTDDPEYIVRLVGQVVRVSVETMSLVSSLPEFQST